MITTIHVAAVLLFSQEKVLLARRKPGRAFDGLLEIPGGKIEPGETIIQAANREIQEELETTLTNIFPFMNFTWRGPNIQVTLSTILANSPTKPKKSNDHSELLWISPVKLPIFIKYNHCQITKPDIPILEVLAKQYQANPEYFSFLG